MDIAAEDSDDGGLQARSAATRRLQAISLGHGLSVVTGVYHIAIDAMNFRSFPFLMSVFNIPKSLPPIVPRIYGLTRTQPALRHRILHSRLRSMHTLLRARNGLSASHRHHGSMTVRSKSHGGLCTLQSRHNTHDNS